MAEAPEDRWASWLARRRHGDDPEMLRRTLEYLVPVRDRVIAGAHLDEGATALDVGCGDGLIAFAACDEVGEAGSVIFSDVSEALLQQCRDMALEAGIADRCRFERAVASDLTSIDNGSVNAVTLRSVLIYEADKTSAFAEFHRVLRTGGWLSLFEPINRFVADAHSEPGRMLGRDLRAVPDLIAKVWAVYEAIQPSDTDPMLNFDERDLVRLAEATGFTEVHLQFNADIEPVKPMAWDTFLNSSGNPRVPTFGEAMVQTQSSRESTTDGRVATPGRKGPRRAAVRRCLPDRQTKLASSITPSLYGRRSLTAESARIAIFRRDVCRVLALLATPAVRGRTGCPGAPAVPARGRPGAPPGAGPCRCRLRPRRR